MRTLNPIALAILTLLLSSVAAAQSAKPASDSSMSTTTPAANVDDEAFNSTSALPRA